jgi:DNA-binding MarR family transcriptional regulator
MEPTSTDDVLLDAVRLAMSVSIRAADEVGDVSAVQLRALTVLRSASGANLGRLAQEMGVTVSTASRLVDRLVVAGLADRRTSPESRREISLALSPEGERTLDRYDQLRLDGVRACLHRVPAGERDDVVAALQALVAATAPVTEPAG